MVDLYPFMSLNFITKFTRKRERVWRELGIKKGRDEIFVSNLSHEWYYMY